MDMEHWHSSLILWGVEVTAGGERKDGCMSMSVTSFGGLGMWDCVLVGPGKLQAKAPSISSGKRSLLGPGYASG